jgi:hypothetical protein
MLLEQELWAKGMLGVPVKPVPIGQAGEEAVLVVLVTSPT